MAYIDGQMSASEALEFERSLSPEDQRRLADEIRVEAVICDHLATDTCCPEALWNSIKLRVRNQSQKRSPLGVWQRRFVGVAASIAIVTTSALIYRDFAPERNIGVASSLEISEDNLVDFANHTEVPGTREATQHFLDKHDIALELVALDAAELDAHHPVKLLGACMGSCPRGSILELRLTCCNRPVKLLVIKEGSGRDMFVRRAMRCGKVKESREVNGVLIALVGDIHGHTDLLNLLQPPSDQNLV